MKILVTGGAGFIGSAVVRHLIADTSHSVVNVDKLTYASDLRSVAPAAGDPRYHFVQADICDTVRIQQIFEVQRPDAVMHLAAESHVDRSIDGPDNFVMTNIVGTYRMLVAASEYHRAMPEPQKSRFLFHHISTDEVFGSLRLGDAPFCETTAYDPRSPYAASKASSDHLVKAWGHTFGLPVVLTNCTNNYGPYQFPEKLMPLIILRALEGGELPVYGKGENIRDWLYVDDHARALVTILERGKPGESYCISGGNERTNLSIVEALCDMVDEFAGPMSSGKPRRTLIRFVVDRPGHDFRYAMRHDKLREQLGWSPLETLESGMRKTVRWYIDNSGWWEPLRVRYDGRRLGIAGSG